jgi:xanthine dehydrogenase YagT iron-sulfur-binding subunit
MSLVGKPLALQINRQQVKVDNVPEDVCMADFLHEYLNMTGTRVTCGQGICHACVVILDHPDGKSETMRTCITGAHLFAGKRIRTIEGHAVGDPNSVEMKLTQVQDAFLKNFAFQCSYCTPGFVNESIVLLERLKRQPIARKDVEQVITDALDSHLCRCTGYVRYYEALRQLIVSTPSLIKE